MSHTEREAAAMDTEGGNLTPTYIGVLILETVVIVLLWVLGRLFS
jgi:hypothetical protein